MTSATRAASRVVVIRQGAGETCRDVILILAFVTVRRMLKARDVEGKFTP
jgi:hypothetical protein